MRRIWTQPTFEVHGISGGYHGPGVKTSIPCRAEAKVSIRLVPNQKPKEVFRKLKSHLVRLNPNVQVFPAGFLQPYLGDRKGPYTEAAQEAFRFGFGREAALIREGGSIGAVVLMKEFLKAPIVMMGLSLPEHGYHAPNEYFDWGQASGGMVTLINYFERIAEMKPSRKSGR